MLVGCHKPSCSAIARVIRPLEVPAVTASQRMAENGKETAESELVSERPERAGRDCCVSE